MICLIFKIKALANYETHSLYKKHSTRHIVTHHQVCHIRHVKCNLVLGGQVVRELKPKALSGISVSQKDNKHIQYQLQDSIMKADCEQLSWVVVRAVSYFSIQVPFQEPESTLCLFKYRLDPVLCKKRIWRIWPTKGQKQNLLLETLDSRLY